MPRYLVNWKLDDRRAPHSRRRRWERAFAAEVASRVGGRLVAYRRDRKTGCGTALIAMPDVHEDLGASLRDAARGAIKQLMITRINGRPRLRAYGRAGCDALVSAAGGAADDYTIEQTEHREIDRAA